jgi:hypothetical protein
LSLKKNTGILLKHTLAAQRYIYTQAKIKIINEKKKTEERRVAMARSAR